MHDHAEFITYDEPPSAKGVEALGGRWDLYKRLVADVPEDVVVEKVCVGAHWVYVQATSGLGMAMLVRGGRAGCRLLDGGAGMRLRDLAAYSTSWRFLEATIGVAALNAWYASEPVARANGMTYDEKGENDAFALCSRLVEGKKVTVVGHFPLIERMADRCTLTVLERDPHDADLPDPGCEYILPEQDYAFITGTALTNKTLPRLLALCREGDTPAMLVGPSVVPSPVFFELGVVNLLGSVCLPERSDEVKRAIETCSHTGIFNSGVQKMQMQKPGWKPA